MVSEADLMRRALFHAARAAGATTPNPMVGAVVVSPDGVVVGQGYHARAGAPHAEVVALDQAGARARGATLYVTLEPCCHQGRTPPCSDRLIAAGLAKVVAAMTDPNPLMQGRGFDALREAGIEVSVGLLETDAARLNQPFVTVQTLGRPQVIVKAAVSADRRVAERPGARTPITSAPANRRSQRLRATVDAIAVGSGTVLVDDPLLTVRDSARSRPLVRAVFDRSLRTPASARLLSTLEQGPVIILTGATEAGSARAGELIQAGATVVPIERDDLAAGLRALLPWDVSSVLVEGGPTLHKALFDADLVDVAHVVQAPRRLGDEGVWAFGGEEDPLAGVVPTAVEALGPDTWKRFDVRRR